MWIFIVSCSVNRKLPLVCRIERDGNNRLVLCSQSDKGSKTFVLQKNSISLADVRERVTELDESRLRGVTMNLPMLNVVEIGLFSIVENEDRSVANRGAALKQVSRLMLMALK